MNGLIQDKSTIIVYAYRYIWKTKDGKLNVKFLTECQEVHALFQKTLREDENVVSCVREYLHEINFEYFGFTEPVKIENKEDKTNEEKEN